MSTKTPNFYIAVEGVIGVGKTTLARLLQPRLKADELLLEVFEENPFLPKFYEAPARYAFQTQVFFLLSRYYQQNRTVPAVLNAGKSLIADYTFEKDTLFARINLGGDELAMYYRVHEALAEKIPTPDLVVYLRAEPEVLMQRIAMRDRPYERNMDPAYIARLHEAYEDHFANHHRGAPVLTIDTTNMDFVRYPDHLEEIENRIRRALRLTPYQSSLPF